MSVGSRSGVFFSNPVILYPTLVSVVYNHHHHHYYSYHYYLAKWVDGVFGQGGVFEYNMYICVYCIHCLKPVDRFDLIFC